MASHPWIRRLYSGALLALSPLVWRRVWREHLPGRSRLERLGYIPVTPDHIAASEHPLWLHCASVGEVMAARPLIEALRQQYPGRPLTITTMTATGAEQALSLAKNSDAMIRHHFVPLDFPFASRRFVTRLRPALAIFFETELWPNLLAVCERRGVPVAVVNGRLSERAFVGYRKVRRLMGEALSHVSWLGAKADSDIERFRWLGMAAEKSQVTGSLKFDIDTNGGTFQVSKHLLSLMDERPVWVAGSTHPGEDEQLLAAHRALREQLPDALLILVPRHPQRFEAVAQLCRDEGFTLARRSLGELPDGETAIYLGDTMGELQALYCAGQLAFVGGSLVPVGGHNLLEPAAFGIPVISGPQLANFSDVAEVMHDADALVEVADETALAEVLVRLLNDPVARRQLGDAGQCVVEANRGALERTLAGLEVLLPTSE
ncbi:MAG: lipid IV(A) 3-deoxy-D-manno-octulosonic acid transferase [Halomonas sp.]|uniref:lipid IV(A) 3-deoxy-D-manno-octulosonic acid transferase n=1 Tax=Halomonas sp. TaxID=1486246 RepID=UPI003F8DE498